MRITVLRTMMWPVVTEGVA